MAQSATHPRVTRFLPLLGGVELACLALFAWVPAIPLPIPRLLLFGGAFACYLAAARETRALGSAEAPRTTTQTIRWIWAIALAARVILVPLTPELSDDIYRYLWDGHVQLQGVNPYQYAPADPTHPAIRTPWFGLINHSEVPTIYPPVAQLTFLVTALAGSTVLAAKLLWLLLDLGTALLLRRIAIATGRNEATVLLLYLWSPLLIIEVAWSAHFEPLGLFLTMAFVLIADHFSGPRPLRAGAALALAALAKFAPAAALPPTLRRHGWKAALSFVLVSLALYLPYASVGSGLVTGLQTYARHWRANEGLFGLLELATTGAVAPRVVSAALVLGVILWTTVRRFDAERALFWILGAGLLLSPTVHPWYVLWALPFAALRGNGPWIVLTGTIALGYWGLAAYQESGIWPQPLWVRALIWTPMLAVFLGDRLRLRRRERVVG